MLGYLRRVYPNAPGQIFIYQEVYKKWSKQEHKDLKAETTIKTFFGTGTVNQPKVNKTIHGPVFAIWEQRKLDLDT